MPINEPNFGAEYILDYGDLIQIKSYGRDDQQYFEIIKRDGSITIEALVKSN